MKEGDRNIAFFQAVANQRTRKKHIVVLESPNCPITETKDMPNHATNFYKSLFGHDDNIGLSLYMKFWENHDKVSEEENMFLDAPFTDDETRTTIFYSYAKGAPGPNGFSFLFYKKWT